jgi:hypothetical protein
MLRYIIQLSLMHNRRIPYTKPFTQSAQMPVATRLIHHPSTRTLLSQCTQNTVPTKNFQEGLSAAHA